VPLPHDVVQHAGYCAEQTTKQSAHSNYRITPYIKKITQTGMQPAYHQVGLLAQLKGLVQNLTTEVILCMIQP